jgi:hypothetical protein
MSQSLSGCYYLFLSFFLSYLYACRYLFSASLLPSITINIPKSLPLSQDHCLFQICFKSVFFCNLLLCVVCLLLLSFFMSLPDWSTFLMYSTSQWQLWFCFCCSLSLYLYLLLLSVALFLSFALPDWLAFLRHLSMTILLYILLLSLSLSLYLFFFIFISISYLLSLSFSFYLSLCLTDWPFSDISQWQFCFRFRCYLYLFPYISLPLTQSLSPLSVALFRPVSLPDWLAFLRHL